MIKFSSPLFLFGIAIMVIVPVASIIFAEVCTSVWVPIDPPECRPTITEYEDVDIGPTCSVARIMEYCSSRYETVILGEKINISDDDSWESKIGSYEDIFSDRNELFQHRDCLSQNPTNVTMCLQR